MHAHPACNFMQVHNVPVIPLYACIFSRLQNAFSLLMHALHAYTV